ncbi:MAG TPA: hypothetical protein VGQ73_05170 [Gemmatimonadales bacterium]|jgi:hypothetical protein|nr:hypothetical protein [Gemmatimonadales bacterium]
MTEAQLLQTASQLGTEVVAELDEHRIAEAVLTRLASEPVQAVKPVRSIARRIVIGLAVAAALLLVVRLTVRPPDRPTAGSSLSVLHELDDLNSAELEALLESLPPAATAAAHPDPASLDQLDPKDLERLLRSLEG